MCLQRVHLSEASDACASTCSKRAVDVMTADTLSSRVCRENTRAPATPSGLLTERIYGPPHAFKLVKATGGLRSPAWLVDRDLAGGEQLYAAGE